jgi:hypothetical protein
MARAAGDTNPPSQHTDANMLNKTQSTSTTREREVSSAETVGPTPCMGAETTASSCRPGSLRTTSTAHGSAQQYPDKQASGPKHQKKVAGIWEGPPHQETSNSCWLKTLAVTASTNKEHKMRNAGTYSAVRHACTDILYNGNIVPVHAAPLDAPQPPLLMPPHSLPPWDAASRLLHHTHSKLLQARLTASGRPILKTCVPC